MNNGINWEVEIESNAYNAGPSEDGEMMEGLCFYLIATAPNGRRFAHVHNFNSASRNQLEQAKSDVRYLLARVQVAQAMGNWAGPKNNPHWRETQPAYGSEAYANNWMEIEADRKAMEMD